MFILDNKDIKHIQVTHSCKTFSIQTCIFFKSKSCSNSFGTPLSLLSYNKVHLVQPSPPAHTMIHIQTEIRPTQTAKQLLATKAFDFQICPAFSLPILKWCKERIYISWCWFIIITYYNYYLLHKKYITNTSILISLKTQTHQHKLHHQCSKHPGK